MNLSEFCNWSISDEGWKSDIELLSRLLVVNDFPNLYDVAPETTNSKIDWNRLLLVASVLTQSEERNHLEAALTIAQAGIVISDSVKVKNSCIIVLNQLYNSRTSNDAVKKGYVQDGYLSKLGLSARILAFREEIESQIFSSIGLPIAANKFQIEFWNTVDENDRIYALAPTASGKSFIVLKYIIEQLILKKIHTVIYVAPTRALVAEVEQNFRNLSQQLGFNDLDVSSIPIRELSETSNPCIYVFTQERLHIFLNSVPSDYAIDVLIVDEVQKLSDGMRGVILQDAIERVLRINEKSKIIYLSPNAVNPEFLFNDVPGNIKTKIVDRDQPMVSQNMIWATESNKADTTKWKLELKGSDESKLLGYFDLKDRPTTIAKQLAMIAVSLTGDNTGTMIYANEPSEAEDIAEFIAELLPDISDSNLKSLSDLAKDGVHSSFKLVKTALKGVAFHYGNMPSLIREEIEDLFNKGIIRYLICTSTLIEGVNLSCKTIIVKGPKKGRLTPMEDQDFWNLAGRAGRWGKEFQGNIVCVDPEIWKTKPPQRTKFILKRQTDTILNDESGLKTYLNNRNFNVKTIDNKGNYESVFAYLLTSFIRDEGLTTLQLEQNYESDYINDLSNVLSEISVQIDIPKNIIEKHSGISAVSMQTLLNYFRESYNSVSKGKPIVNLIPVTPESANAYSNMEGILRRIHLKLFPGFGFGNQYKHFAVLILNWMQGYTLKRLIQSAINNDAELVALNKKKNTKSVHAIIRDTMREVEEFARFKAPKYISCYTDILKVFLAEQNQLQLYPNDYPFDLFLEFGVMSKTLLSLVGLGLSRMSATEIGEMILESTLSKEECLKWLSENISEKDLPNFVKREVFKKLLVD